MAENKHIVSSATYKTSGGNRTAVPKVNKVNTENGKHTSIIHIVEINDARKYTHKRTHKTPGP